MGFLRGERGGSGGGGGAWLACLEEMWVALLVVGLALARGSFLGTRALFKGM